MSNPGQVLKEAREALQLTQEQAAAQLHYAVRIIRDLEENQYQNNSSFVFMRGYLRSYARLLHLSEEALMKNLELFLQKDDAKNVQSDLVIPAKEELKMQPVQASNDHFSVEPKSSKVSPNKRIRYMILMLMSLIAIFLFQDFYQASLEHVNNEAFDEPAVSVQMDLPIDEGNHG